MGYVHISQRVVFVNSAKSSEVETQFLNIIQLNYTYE